MSEYYIRCTAHIKHSLWPPLMRRHLFFLTSCTRNNMEFFRQKKKHYFHILLQHTNPSKYLASIYSSRENLQIPMKILWQISKSPLIQWNGRRKKIITPRESALCWDFFNALIYRNKNKLLNDH